ncbi:hypothetical protein B0H14DRAFT_3902212 [Mycena olivaceomarginata]|nr:hypothetical protein B0H14DRAFT_3902212 [Mycena olivaceomarginata]
MPVTGDAPVVESTRRVVIRHSPRVEVPQETPGTTLFCGAPQPLSAADLDSQEPWRVQFLPIQDAPPPRKRQRLDRPKSNGCGAAVHNAAIPKSAIWHGADANATDVVLPLDDKYVPQVLTTIMKTRREECGCLRNPVGCAVCGNPLRVRIRAVGRVAAHTSASVTLRSCGLSLRVAPHGTTTPLHALHVVAAPGAPTPRAVAMEGEDGADEAALFSGVPRCHALPAVPHAQRWCKPRSSRGTTEGVTALVHTLLAPTLPAPPVPACWRAVFL